MTTRTIDVHALLRKYEDVAGRAQQLAFPVRDIGLQKKHLEDTLAIHDELRAAKLGAIAARRSDLADRLLGFQAVARALAEELRMWVAMREGDPHGAWCALVVAQQHAHLALRTPMAHAGIEEYARRLDMVEQTAFPRLAFASTGFEHDTGRCSICNKRFDKCEHEEGLIYSGQVCAEVDFKNSKLDHISIVDSPRDKRCYVRSFEEGDGTLIDTMTRLPMRSAIPGGGERPAQGRSMQFTVFVNETPPGVMP